MNIDAMRQHPKFKWTVGSIIGLLAATLTVWGFCDKVNEKILLPARAAEKARLAQRKEWRENSALMIRMMDTLLVLERAKARRH